MISIPSASELKPTSQSVAPLNFDSSDDDKAHWWQSTAPLFTKMMRDFNYDEETQSRHLHMYQKCVIPFLGPYPTKSGLTHRWMSTLTRFGLPFELSTNLSNSMVRFAFEPVTIRSGTEQDPFNLGSMWPCIERLRSFGEDINVERFKQFIEKLVVTEDDARYIADNKLTTDCFITQYNLAVDLKGNETTWKMYTYPSVKSLATGIPLDKLLFDSIRYVDSKGEISSQLQVLEDYFASKPADNCALQPVCPGFPYMVSCDLVAPSSSRIKLYGATTHADGATIEDLWTLGGRQRNESSLAGLKMLMDLWELLDIPTGPRKFPTKYHEIGTSPKELVPIMMNYTLHPSEPRPEPQIYFFTFGLNDMAIATAVASFFRQIGRSDIAETYVSNACSYYPDLDLNKTNHTQALVSFSYRKGKPYVSVYHHSFEACGYSKASSV